MDRIKVEGIKVEVADFKGGLNGPTPEVNQVGPMTDLLNSQYVGVVEYIIPKADLIEYISNNLTVKAGVYFVPKSAVEFSKLIIHDERLRSGEFEYSNGVSLEELNNLKRLYFPSVEGTSTKSGVVTQPLQGLFEIKVKKEDAYDKKEAKDLFEYSTMDNPEELYKTPVLKKFTLKNYRKIFSTNVDTGVMTHYIPVVLVALSKLGFNPEDILRTHYVSLGESANSILVHVRKDDK